MPAQPIPKAIKRDWTALRDSSSRGHGQFATPRPNPANERRGSQTHQACRQRLGLSNKSPRIASHGTTRGENAAEKLLLIPLHMRNTGGPSLPPNPPRSALATILSSPLIPAGTRHEYEQVFPQP